METEVLIAVIYTIGLVLIAFLTLRHFKQCAELDSETKIERERMRTNADIYSAKAEAGALDYGQTKDEGGFFEKIISSAVTNNPELVSKLVSSFTQKKQ